MKKLKLLNHVKMMGAKKIEIDYRLSYDHDGEIEHIRVDGNISHLLDRMDQLFIKQIMSIAEEQIASTTLPRRLDDDWYARGEIEIDLETDKVTHTCGISYEMEGENEDIENTIDIPPELHLSKMPSKLQVIYSGGGDDGGIDEIIYNGKGTEEFKTFDEWINDNDHLLIPDGADFNNAGSSGTVQVTIKDHQMLCVADHIQNIDGEVDITIDTKIEDLEIEAEI